MHLGCTHDFSLCKRVARQRSRKSTRGSTTGNCFSFQNQFLRDYLTRLTSRNFHNDGILATMGSWLVAWKSGGVGCTLDWDKQRHLGDEDRTSSGHGQHHRWRLRGYAVDTLGNATWTRTTATPSSSINYGGRRCPQSPKERRVQPNQVFRLRGAGSAESGKYHHNNFSHNNHNNDLHH